MAKLLELLQTLDKKELQSFSRYLHSPYFCQHQESISLLDYLVPQHPDFAAAGFEQVKAHFPDWQLTRARYNVLKNYLVNHFQGFLIQQELESRPVQQQSLLVDALLQRNRFKEAEKQLQVAQELLPPKGVVDGSNYYQRVSLAEQELHLSLSVEMRSAETTLQDLMDRLQQFEMGWGLKYLLPAWTLHRLYGHDFPEARWKKYQAAMAQGEEIPVLTRMYAHLLHLLRGEQPAANRSGIQTLLAQYADQMSKVELMNVYGYLQNHFTHQLLKGDQSAYRELFQLYQQLDRHALVFGRSEFSGHLIRNITVTGCRLGELDWTRNFLQVHREDIEQELGGNALAYSLAYLEFSSRNYQLALRHLQDLEFIDPFYRTGHQTLLLRIYYELNDFVSLEALSATFRRYLNRSSLLSQTQKDLHRNFISTIRQLTKARETGLNTRLKAKIRHMLDSFSSVTDRPWLEQKLLELESGPGS